MLFLKLLHTHTHTYPTHTPTHTHTHTHSNLLGNVNKKGAKKTKTGAVPTSPSPLDHPLEETPRELPTELWRSCLQSLYLQGNQIKFLPDYVGELDSLARIDISG